MQISADRYRVRRLAGAAIMALILLLILSATGYKIA